jgi:predicted RNase H-like nuclease (RuvC/YqgF family)
MSHDAILGPQGEQQAINRLRERISQLEHENAGLKASTQEAHRQKQEAINYSQRLESENAALKAEAPTYSSMQGEIDALRAKNEELQKEIKRLSHGESIPTP